MSGPLKQEPAGPHRSGTPALKGWVDVSARTDVAQVAAALTLAGGLAALWSPSAGAAVALVSVAALVAW